jgi:predicted permease
MLDSIGQDLRHSVRSLARAPGLVAVVATSLALGIGVNTAIFSALNGLLFRPLALRNLDRTVYVYHADPQNPDRGTSFPAYVRYRERTDVFSAVMAFAGARPLSLIDGDRRDLLYGELVTADYFSIADARVRLGRPFTAEVDSAGSPSFVAVLSDRLWRRRFEANPDIVGRTLNLNGLPVVVIGVAEPNFPGLDPEAVADLWIPMAAWAHMIGEPGRLTGDERWMTTVAVLRDGVSLGQAQAAMAAEPPLPAAGGWETRVRPARDRSAGATLDILAMTAAAFAAGLLVLTLACTNVANLLMAKAAARQPEMSVRMALGGSRGRLLRLWLTECVLLVLPAATLGVFVGAGILRLAVAFKPPVLIGDVEAPTLPLDVGLDGAVLGFALGLSVLTAVAIGLISGLQGTRSRVMPGLRGQASDRRFAPGLNVRSAVIALQMALSMLLLIPSGLMIRSAMKASGMPAGFSSDRILLLPISADQAGIRIRKPPGFEQQLVARVSTLAGVESATAVDPVPLWFAGSYAHFAPATSPPGRGAERAGFSRVTPGYFATLRIPLLRGRDFTASDVAEAPAVAIVNDTMARRMWPDRSALGERLRFRDGVLEIVGVARDTKHISLADAEQPWLYLPLAQHPTNNRSLSLAVRTAGDPLALRSAIEREVRALVPTWPTFQFRTLDEGLDLQQLLPRIAAALLGVLGGLGLLLGAVGVYGVMAYVVRQRTHELGIRLALGSTTSGVLAIVVRQGLWICLIGGAIGLMAALLSAQWLSSVLVGVSPLDPVTYALVPSLMLAVAALACYVPARHVTRLNPVALLSRE